MEDLTADLAEDFLVDFPVDFLAADFAMDFLATGFFARATGDLPHLLPSRIRAVFYQLSSRQ
ncbi:MAG: hypothetical protein OD811_03240 [Alphaproteobacteria bacterium]